MTMVEDLALNILHLKFHIADNSSEAKDKTAEINVLCLQNTSIT